MTSDFSLKSAVTFKQKLLLKYGKILKMNNTVASIFKTAERNLLRQTVINLLNTELMIYYNNKVRYRGLQKNSTECHAARLKE
jgi:hypothetical protein